MPYDAVSSISRPGASIARCTSQGPGRDPRFRLSHYATTLRGLRTVFFDAGSGPPIVFIHGLAGNASHFLHVAPRLTERARVIGLDLPGCGGTDFPMSPLTVDGLVAHVMALIERLRLPPAMLVGHSLGGMVALRGAIEHPERVCSVILINSAGFCPFPSPIRLAAQALHPVWLGPILKRGWQGVLGRVFYDDNARTRAFIENVIATHDTERDLPNLARVISDLSRDVTRTNLTHHLPEMSIPIWKIWGDQDRLVPSSVLRQIAAAAPNVVAEEIPRCGHMPIIERPEPVIAMIERALAAQGKVVAA